MDKRLLKSMLERLDLTTLAKILEDLEYLYSSYKIPNNTGYTPEQFNETKALIDMVEWEIQTRIGL